MFVVFVHFLTPSSHHPHTILVLLSHSYPGMRWFTTLLAREFDMPDCLRLWDSLFAHIYQTKTLEFLVSICANIVLSQSEVLMAGALNVSCLCLLLATQFCLFLFHTCIDSLVHWCVAFCFLFRGFCQSHHHVATTLQSHEHPCLDHPVHSKHQGSEQPKCSQASFFLLLSAGAGGKSHEKRGGGGE